MALGGTGGPGQLRRVQSAGTVCDADSYQGLRQPAGAGWLLAVAVRPSFLPLRKFRCICPAGEGQQAPPLWELGPGTCGFYAPTEPARGVSLGAPRQRSRGRCAVSWGGQATCFTPPECLKWVPPGEKGVHAQQPPLAFTLVQAQLLRVTYRE